MTSETIPRIGHTVDTPVDQKTIHQKWHIPEIRFYWLIAEIDPKEKLAFGYANLNDENNAEWGYISLAELEETGATMDTIWTPKTFSKARMEK